MMSIMERLEFGVMLAIGTSPMQLFRLIVYEGLLLACLLCCRTDHRYAIVAYFGSVGIGF